MTFQQCVDAILISGCDDWVNVTEVMSVAKFTGGARSEAEIRELAMKIIREVVLQGLMEIGDLPGRSVRLDRVTKVHHLDHWLLPPERCLDRLGREWDALGRNPSLGELCWLENTAKGNALGEALLKQRKRKG